MPAPKTKPRKFQNCDGVMRWCAEAINSNTDEGGSGGPNGVLTGTPRRDPGWVCDKNPNHAEPAEEP